MAVTDMPLASHGLVSYRYRGPYGWIMVGAYDDGDALRQARRSTMESVTLTRLERWNGKAYIAAQ